MRGKVVLGVLMLTGILVLSATAAQAGGGGVVTPLTSFFVCNSISGDAAGQIVDVEASVLGPSRQSVTVGNGVLACTPTFLFYPNGGPEIDPGTGNDLKCYSASFAKKPGSPPGQKPVRYNATDALLGDETEIQGSETKYICGPSTFTISTD